MRTLTHAVVGCSIALATANVAARPQYGGVLRVEMPALLRTLDPVAAPTDPADGLARARILPLIFENLVTIDERGGIAPQLASSWEHDGASKRWRFRLRSSIRLHDGSVLDAPQAAAALRAAGSLRVSADADTIVIETDRDAADLPWELASPRMGVVIRRGSDVLGTGPFRVERFESPRLLLRAHEDYWKGRPFVDAVEIVMGQAPADATTGIEVGKVDVAAIGPSEASRLAARGARILASRPIDLVALVFEEQRALPASQPIRSAVATAVDRASLCSVVLQHAAHPATTILPDWLSGYAALAGTAIERSSLRSLVAAVPASQRSLALRVESAAPIDRAIADRIVVDAREAGLTLRIDPVDALAPRPDVRLVRVRLDATSPDRALAAALAALGPRVVRLMAIDGSLRAGAPLDEVYRLERAVLEPKIVVPIVHTTDVYGVGPNVETWNGPPIRASGAWDFGEVWMRAVKP